MGEYFNEENDVEEVKEEPKKIFNLDDKELNELVVKRARALENFHKFKKEYNDRIGLINLDIFGDPQNPDFQSKLDMLNDTLEHSALRRHSIYSLIKDIMQSVKEFQMEFSKIKNLYENTLAQIGDLFDDSLVELDNRVVGGTQTKKIKEKDEIIEINLEPEREKEIIKIYDSCITALQYAELMNPKKSKLDNKMEREFIRKHHNENPHSFVRKCEKSNEIKEKEGNK